MQLTCAQIIYGLLIENQSTDIQSVEWIIIRLEARLQPNIGFTLWGSLAAFTRLAMLEVNSLCTDSQALRAEYCIVGIPPSTAI